MSTTPEETMSETRATVPVSYQEAAAVKFAAEGLTSILDRLGAPGSLERHVVEHNIERLIELHDKVVDATPET